MFEDSILESANHLEARRGWSALTAAALQISVIALLILMPLLRPALILPSFTAPEPILTFARVEPQPPGPAPSNVPITEASGPLAQPSRIPLRVFREATRDVSPNPVIAIPCTADCSGAASALNALPATPIPRGPQTLIAHISNFQHGALLQRVTPEYPPLAKAARIQGWVVLNAIIGKDGSVQNLEVASGHPMLAAAALRAVSQWKFRPYILDGAPIEVETQIAVHFTLANQ